MYARRAVGVDAVKDGATRGVERVCHESELRFGVFLARSTTIVFEIVHAPGCELTSILPLVSLASWMSLCANSFEATSDAGLRARRSVDPELQPARVRAWT